MPRDFQCQDEAIAKSRSRYRHRLRGLAGASPAHEKREPQNNIGSRQTFMAKCELGYLCEVCGAEVEDITQSDLYLRFVLGEVEARYLMTAKERHLRCNPVSAQFIVDPGFEPVVVEGPFDKRNQDPVEVARREARTTLAWRRLQEVRSLGIPISDYPLDRMEMIEE